ncbi:MAG: hypothetical protein J5859_01045 [Clostridia bacterium]|nr:hypothetical protein [Clostridia bacterium]
MEDLRDVKEKTDILRKFAMAYETYVQCFPAADYPDSFRRFYEVKTKGLRLVPAEEGFRAALKEVSGDDPCGPIAQKTEDLFGLPLRVTVFEDDTALRDEMEGPDGLGPFFFIFGIMFCEYAGFTLCFISGSNN